MTHKGAPSLVLIYCSLSLFSAFLSSASLTDVINKPPHLLTPGSSGGAGTPSSSCDDSPQAFLDAHNVVRKALGEAPLVWNNTLVSYAESYANKRKDCAMVHSAGPYGENLAMGSGDLSAAAAVQLWVDERKDYHHDSSPAITPEMTCLHYTQVVWSQTTSVGCAKVQCENGRGVFITCNYYPQGNFVGQKPF